MSVVKIQCQPFETELHYLLQIQNLSTCIQLQHSLVSAALQYFCMNPIHSRWMNNPFKTAPMKHYKHTCRGFFCFFGKIKQLRECCSRPWFAISGGSTVRGCCVTALTQQHAGSPRKVKANLLIILQHSLSSIKKLTRTSKEQ